MHDRETTVIEATESANSALTESSQRADEIFLEGPRSRFDESGPLSRLLPSFTSRNHIHPRLRLEDLSPFRIS